MYMYSQYNISIVCELKKDDSSCLGISTHSQGSMQIT